MGKITCKDCYGSGTVIINDMQCPCFCVCISVVGGPHDGERYLLGEFPLQHVIEGTVCHTYLHVNGIISYQGITILN